MYLVYPVDLCPIISICSWTKNLATQKNDNSGDYVDSWEILGYKKERQMINRENRKESSERSAWALRFPIQDRQRL